MPTDTTSRGGWASPSAVFLGRILRPVIAGGLLWYAAHDLDWGSVAQAMAGASWRWIGIALLLLVIDRTLMAWRWWLLLRAVEPECPLPWLPALRVFFVSSFAGSFLPGSLGGDALRAMGVTRLGVTTANGVASVAVDRLLGTVSVFLMSVFGVWLVGRLIDPRLLPVAALTALVAVVVTYGLLFDDRLFRWMLQRLQVRRLPTVDRLAHKFLAAVGQYGQHRRTLAGVLTLSVGVQSCERSRRGASGWRSGLLWPAIGYFAIVPVIVVIVLLPISIGGLGTANAAFVVLFSRAGIDNDPAFVLSVLFLALGFVGNLPGGLWFALAPSPKPTPDA